MHGLSQTGMLAQLLTCSSLQQGTKAADMAFCWGHPPVPEQYFRRRPIKGTEAVTSALAGSDQQHVDAEGSELGGATGVHHHPRAHEVAQHLRSSADSRQLMQRWAGAERETLHGMIMCTCIDVCWVLQSWHSFKEGD